MDNLEQGVNVYIEGMNQATRQIDALSLRAAGREFTQEELEHLGRLSKLYQFCRGSLLDLLSVPERTAPQPPAPPPVPQPAPVPVEYQPERRAKRARTVPDICYTERQSWADQYVNQRELPEKVELPVPVVYGSPDITHSAVLTDEIDRRARAYLSWAPWARRARVSRRYEGFGR